MRIILITGLSGAGKLTALRALEDMGCEAIDNAPLSLIPSLVASDRGVDHCIAIGTDARSRDFSPRHFEKTLRELKAGHDARLIFLDADNETLQRRFTETRRKHPLALDRPVMDGILHERSMLGPLRGLADAVFDTSEWTSADLRQTVRDFYGTDARALSVFVTSFSFKKGLPRDADLVFDVRFLRNPFYDDTLRPFTGLDAPVAAFIESDPGFTEFFNNLSMLIEPLLPRYLQEGKSYLTIAIGCTGGRHRSVRVAEKLAGFLKEREYKVGVRHRDIGMEHMEK
jgi:RNase adapter protein RapZ